MKNKLVVSVHFPVQIIKLNIKTIVNSLCQHRNQGLNVFEWITILSPDTILAVYDWGISVVWMCIGSPTQGLHLFSPDWHVS